ncbi:DUF2252 family protein [Microbacterium sp. MYb62]|nr:DUF2252 family protein [Microbacterium sp. MYb62]
MAGTGFADEVGDAYLTGFGLFGTQERPLIFDMNDVDETFSSSKERS